MGNSLFDQLKKVGLVDEKRAKQVKTEKYKSQKQQAKNKDVPTEEAKRLAQAAQAEEVERNRALNRQRQDDAERKAVAAQIKQLIEANRLKERDGEIAYNFSHEGKVKRIYVSEDIRKQLSAGQLAIVVFNNRFDVVPEAAAEKIKQRNVRCVVTIDASSQSEAEDKNDPYANYKIPDDLIW